MDYFDDKTAMAVDRRRRMEEERRQRIFNDKLRTKGVDMSGVEEQIRIKRETKEQEEAREKAIAEELLNMERQIKILAQRHEEAKKKVAADVMNENQFLSNIRRTPTGSPALEMDTNMVGASNMLRFTGEDPDKKDRTKLQQQQIVQWNEEQVRLKSQRHKADKEADVLYDQQTRAMHIKLSELEKDHARAKANVKAADREYNKFLGELKRDKEIMAKQEDAAASLYEVQASLQNPLLTEKGNTTSSISANRVVPYAFKGMSPEQRRSILDEQDRQRKDKEEARRLQEEQERQWAAQQAAVQRAAMLREREVQRTREDMNKKLQNDHARMAKEKTDRYDHLNKTVYANQATDDFFNQFNTSSR